MKKTKTPPTKSKKLETKTSPVSVMESKVKDECCGDGSCHTGKKGGMFKKLFFLLLIIVLAYAAFQFFTEKTKMDQFKKTTIPAAVKKVIGDQKLDYTIKNVTAVSGIYKFDVVIKTNGAEQSYSSFITQDGKLFFVSGIELVKLGVTDSKTTPSPAAKKMTCDDVPKAATPKLTAFIVADCPYGLQTQRLFKKAVNDISAIASNLEVKYIGSVENGKITSMHGDKEAQENLKQICIREEQANAFYPYLSCYMQEGKSDECNATSGVNTANIKACMDDKSRGLKYAAADFALANKFSVGGSPTLLLNNEKVVSEFDFGGRNVKAVKDMLCCSAGNKLSYCSATASSEDIATAYSKEDLAAKTAGGSAPAANCATN